MNIFSVYTKKDGDAIETTFVKQGFSFFAGVFTIFWSAYHKMWSVFLIAIVVNLILAVSGDNDYGVSFLIFIFFAFFASDLREYYAKKRGYVLDDIIVAKSIEEAEMKYFERESLHNEKWSM